MKNQRIRHELRQLLVGAPEITIEAWYDAVYANPDVSSVESLMSFALERMTIADLTKLTRAFETNFRAGIAATKSYFWQLLNIAEFDPAITEYQSWVIEHPEDGSLMTDGSMMSYFYELDALGNLTSTRFLINPSRFTDYSIGDAILAVAYEAWHGFQAVTLSRAVRGGGSEIVVTSFPRELLRSQLYLVNSRIMANPAVDGEEAFRGQLIEKEASSFQARTASRIQELLNEHHSIGIAHRLNRMITS